MQNHSHGRGLIACVCLLALLLPADEQLTVSLQYKTNEVAAFQDTGISLGYLLPGPDIPTWDTLISSTYIGITDSWGGFISQPWSGADTMPTDPPGPFFQLSISKEGGNNSPGTITDIQILQ